MAPKLRDVTREFARGDATLQTLREAARAERANRGLADRILQMIAEWERSATTNSARAKSELRARAELLVPTDPDDEPDAPADRGDWRGGMDATTFMYESGLRGQRVDAGRRLD
jgi:hypothetical protein